MNSTSISVVVTLGTSVVAGNAVGMELTWSSAFSSVTITDDKGNTYVTSAAPYLYGGTPAYLALVLRPNVNNGPKIFTIASPTVSSQQLRIGATVVEINGLGSAPIVDYAAAFESSFGSGAAVDNFTTTAANEVALVSASNSAVETVTQNTTWAADVLGADGNIPGAIQAHTILTSSGSNSFSVSPTAGSMGVGFYITSWIAGGPILMGQACL